MFSHNFFFRFLLILAHILNTPRRTSSTNRWERLAILPLPSTGCHQRAAHFFVGRNECFFSSFLCPVSDEWHGLGSRDRTHAGRHALPRGDGRGRAKQPPVGRLESTAEPANPLRLNVSSPLPAQILLCTLQPTVARPRACFDAAESWN